MVKVVKIGNPLRKVNPVKVGKGESTKLLVNLGLSESNPDVVIELEKYRAAAETGAHILADNTIIPGKTTAFRHELLKQFSQPISTVPIYEAAMMALEREGNACKFTDEDILSSIESQARDGVDMMTLHASYRLKDFKKLGSSKRILKVTSRGGSFLTGYFATTAKENPIFNNFNDILDIVHDNGVVLSLGLSLRSGCIHDQLDSCYLSEIRTMSKLVKRALEANVSVMVEGVGHTSINILPRLIRFIKKSCHNVPLRTLGPPVCDIASGMDDVCGAIGAAVAASSGVDLLGVITRSEHISIPSKQDVIDAIRAFAVAVYAADIQRPGELKRNKTVSIMRRERSWSELWDILPFGGLAKNLRNETINVDDDTCTMCGENCALKLASKIWRK